MRIFIGFILLLMLGGSWIGAAESDRQEVIRFLAEPASSGAGAISSSPEEARMLAILEKEATQKPDPELTLALLKYQLAHPAPDDDMPARVIGRVFYEQTDVLLAALNQLKVHERVALWPYLYFGWGKAIEGKNRSLPQVVSRQKKLDLLHGNLMNAKSIPE